MIPVWLALLVLVAEVVAFVYLALVIRSREDMDGDGTCPVYFYRWTLARAFGCSAYLHHWVGDDWSLDMHDHPKRFVSIGLKGGYIEETPSDKVFAALHGWSFVEEHNFRAPWIRTFPAEHQHRVRIVPGTDCWTLVLTGRASRPWGWWHGGTWVHWQTYVGSALLREKVKACS